MFADITGTVPLHLPPLLGGEASTIGRVQQTVSRAASWPPHGQQLTLFTITSVLCSNRRKQFCTYKTRRVWTWRAKAFTVTDRTERETGETNKKTKQKSMSADRGERLFKKLFYFFFLLFSISFPLTGFRRQKPDRYALRTTTTRRTFSPLHRYRTLRSD